MQEAVHNDISENSNFAFVNAMGHKGVRNASGLDRVFQVALGSSRAALRREEMLDFSLFWQLLRSFFLFFALT